MDMENLSITKNTWRRSVRSFDSKIAWLLITACGFALQACKKDATVKLPDVPSKLVIHSYISPQDPVIKVQVNLSAPLYNKQPINQFEPLQHANVTISSNLGSFVLPYDADMGAYVIDSTRMKIRAGLSYSLSVFTPDGKSATASTSIPDANRSLTCALESVSGTKHRYYTIRNTWHDPPTTTNFYRILLQRTSYSLFRGDTINRSYVSSQLIKDTDSQNEFITQKNHFTIIDNLKDSVYVHLLHVSKEYFSFVEKLPEEYSSDNPFAEPLQIYSNIQGGFGIFAGYNDYWVKVAY